ncbi:MAG: ribonuclease catalytic domain-containing protein [Lentisphaeraceae bacterium]|nr:ribonuclease catalytic domain-containing protein [Lentisphaeraceae bacterium]
MQLAQNSAAFFDGTDLKLVYVDDDSKGKLNVRNERGRQFKIPSRNIIQVLEAVSFDQFCSKAESLSDQINSESAEIETEFLWELISENPKEYELAQLAENYFGESTPIQRCALFLSIVNDTVHFKRKGVSFTPRSAEQVEEQEIAEKRKKEKEELKQRIIPWLTEAIKKDVIEEVDEEFLPILNQLEIFLYNRKQNEATRYLSQIIGDDSLKITIFKLLQACGKIDEKADKFLILAGINEYFSQRILETTESLSGDIDFSERKDLTNILTFSIDDSETMDIDDALSLENLDNGGYKVYIHIADVSAYIEKNDILDDEAAQRVTSIYLPTKTVNMFPEKLSQGVASLVAGEDRAAMSFIVEFDENLESKDWEVVLSKVHVDKKLSYSVADEHIEAADELGNILSDLSKIAERIKNSRKEEGAAVFNRPELKIRVKDEKVSVGLVERNSASRNLVSEFMILANSTAARFCARNDVPIIFRTQEKPEDLPETNEDVYDPILFERTIKCMKRSRLSLHPQSHGGLGVDFYTQLTSPIRRYTDLIMQRQLSAYLKGETLSYEPEELMSVLGVAESINSEVKEVQRQAESYWLHVYIKDSMIDTECGAIVISKAPGGYMIELDEIFHKTRLMTQDKLKNGDKITIKIEKVKPDKGSIQMSLV